MQGYDSFYEASIAPELRRLETRRKGTVRRVLALGVVILAAAIVAVFHAPLSATAGTSEDTVITAAFLTGAGAAALIFHLRSKIRRKIKTALLEPTCRFLGLDYNLKANTFPLARFEAVKILPNHDSFRLQDHIHGEHEGVDFQLCGASLIRRVERSDGKGGTKTERQVVFQGLLLIYRFPKPFSARTLVLPDRNWLGNRFAGFRHGERVRLEDPRFERIYEVFSEDQVEARYLLTPGFMERLTELADYLGARGALSFAFDKQNVLIAFNSGRAHFEGGNLFTPLETPERAKALLRELELIYELIERLKLSDRSHL